MMPPSLGRLEGYAFFTLFLGFMLVIFWFGAWGLLEEFFEYIQKKYKIAKWKLSMLFVLFVILMIGFFPQILQKI